ncbi:unnamed protein product [Prunus armeniaca]
MTRHDGAEGDTKLACRKAMWLSTMVPKATQDVAGHEGTGVPKATQDLHEMKIADGHETLARVPKGTKRMENDKGFLCRFPQTTPNC